MRIVKCEGCEYRALMHIEREKCKYCGGKLETIADEIIKKKKWTIK
jgi:rRNA maturation endonuclease Nob1